MNVIKFSLLAVLVPILVSCNQNLLIKEDEGIRQIVEEALSNELRGYFIDFQSDEEFFEHFFNLGKIKNINRFASCYRERSPWMYPGIGNKMEDLPSETQFLLINLDGDMPYLIMIPFVDSVVRSCLSGNSEGDLILIAETGDTLTRSKKFTGLYMISGTDPYIMIKKAWEEIAGRRGTLKLREEKPIPWFTDHFGWCSYNAMYSNISHDSLIRAAQNFNKINIPVKYFIFDAGWQDTKGRVLKSYHPLEEKFPLGLKNTVSQLKNDYGLEQVLVWQTLWGFWAGVDENNFSGKSKKISMLPPPRMNYMLSERRTDDVMKEATVGPGFYPNFLGSDFYIPHYETYFNENFDYLRNQGVDGVKIDAIAWLETAGNGQGGRVKLMKEFMDALQPAATRYFDNTLINCSALSNDYFAYAETSNITRSSPDFRPNEPASHGFHIFTNAHTSFWMGDLILPDWDMFQSGHAAGDYHAAARAISGGPVYSTEEIGTEDTIVLKKLMTSYGRILRCREPGRVCMESLLADPTREKELLKIYNSNLTNYIVGAFNCYYDETENISIPGVIKTADVTGIKGSNFAIYQYQTDGLDLYNSDSHVKVNPGQLEYDLVTFTPIINGLGVIGLTDKYNPGGAISYFYWQNDKELKVELLDGGTFTAYSQNIPKKVTMDSEEIDIDYIQEEKRLTIHIPPQGKSVELKIYL